MIVPDASALVPALSDTGENGELARTAIGGTRHAPHLVDLEVTAALRRMVLRRELPVTQALRALDNLTRLEVTRHPHRDLLTRVWALRDNVSPYDASYVALAELIDATLVTLDRRIGRAPGLQCAIATP